MVAFDSANIEIQKDYQKERFVILEVFDHEKLLLRRLTNQASQLSGCFPNKFPFSLVDLLAKSLISQEDLLTKSPISQEDLAALQRENSLLHTDLLESRELIAALRKEMKDLLEKLNSTNTEDRHVRDMLLQVNVIYFSVCPSGRCNIFLCLSFR